MRKIVKIIVIACCWHIYIYNSSKSFKSFLYISYKKSICFSEICIFFRNEHWTTECFWKFYGAYSHWRYV